MLSSLKRKYRKILDRLDHIISKWYFIESSDSKYICFNRTKPFLNTPITGLPVTVQDSFITYNNVEQEEYYAEFVGLHYIEPLSGWVLDSQLKTYYSLSIPYSYLEKRPSFIKIKLTRHQVLKFDTVISIRYHFPNYWHFFNDVLGQISLVDERGVDTTTPIVVPNGALDIPFIKQIIQSSDTLRNRNWIVLKEGMLIESNRIIVAKNQPNTKLNFSRILRLATTNKALSAKVDRQIFLKRGGSRTRTLTNSTQIEKIALKYGLEIIDNDTLPFEEQRHIFANASVVIGIHGAGLTNLIFRFPRSLKLIEIFPGNLIPPHYYWMCHQLNFEYNCITGENEVGGSFFLDPIMFENSLKKSLLKNTEKSL